MNYAVTWFPSAEAGLFALYIRAADKDDVTQYALAADKILARDPLAQGESRESPARRLWFYRPLCLEYRVDETAKAVYVVGVKWVGR